ncbi:hypothetical protein HEK616_40670 [Streptomyces nigrescens]|uniref:Uncharacterized protein n=1 Tax=Streptomyces nigrescens TaxID=1920 RepID=A0ABM7ZW34_STRNI|nr:hypothetical protein [Streptomyces nigrescens]BDM70580.1 hypothetical protein HEK616_40670 [Streptomyces nigrescens]
MAKIKSTGTVDVEATYEELELLRRALRLVKTFGEVDDWDLAQELLTDLGAS